MQQHSGPWLVPMINYFYTYKKRRRNWRLILQPDGSQRAASEQLGLVETLSRSHLLPALNSVAVIFPLCLIPSFARLISPLCLLLTCVRLDSIYPLLSSPSPPTPHRSPESPSLPLLPPHTADSSSHSAVFYGQKLLFHSAAASTPRRNISFIRTIKAEHWFPGW